MRHLGGEVRGERPTTCSWHVQVHAYDLGDREREGERSTGRSLLRHRRASLVLDRHDRAPARALARTRTRLRSMNLLPKWPIKSPFTSSYAFCVLVAVEHQPRGIVCPPAHPTHGNGSSTSANSQTADDPEARPLSSGSPRNARARSPAPKCPERRPARRRGVLAHPPDSARARSRATRR